MITYEEAKRRALDHITDGGTRDDVALLEDDVMEASFGWIFYYDSREFVEKGNEQARLIGNAPVLVDGENGSIHVTGTAHPIDYYIDNYRKFRSPHPPE